MPKKHIPEKVYILRNANDLATAVTALSRVKPSKDKTYIVKVSLETEKRRSKQNRLSFMWYDQLGAMTGHGKEHERNRCKLHHGIPILRLDEGFNEYCQQVLSPLPYEAQLMAMEHMDVSSLMSVREFSHYLNEIDQEAAANGQPLTHPDDLYWDALMKESPRYA